MCTLLPQSLPNVAGGSVTPECHEAIFVMGGSVCPESNFVDAF